VSELNSVLFAQDPEAKQAKESQAKDGKPPSSFHFDNWIMSEWTLE
jgi:hypothetical protein